MRKMKLRLWGGMMLLALAASEPAAHAQRVNFTYTGKLVTWTVPKNGTYQIIAYGAQGESVSDCNLGGCFPGLGGRGAEIGGNFVLAAGEALQIAVGGAGSDGGEWGGGGGGTFVVGPGGTPLVIAGGGGGGGEIGGGLSGGAGLTGQNGGGVNGFLGGFGGTNGNGGGSGGFGGGGGGFFSAGGSSQCAGGGGAFPDLTGGGGALLSVGGFGGGGGCAGGGGGGGYSGGGGGTTVTNGDTGGSFDAATDQILIADLQTGNGEVVIMEVPPVFAGTPGKPNCSGKSVSALARQYGGLNAAAEALGYPSVDALQKAIMEFCEG